MTIRPSDIVVRCMGYKAHRGVWVAKCIDFDLVAEGASLQESREILISMIHSYIETVLKTEDKASISHLLLRRAPLKDRLIFSLIRILGSIRHKHNGPSAFEDALPVHLGYACN